MAPIEAAGGAWAIATPHAAASEIGAAALRDGGNAIDAAIAAAAALTVVYPHMCAVGGDIMAIVRTADGAVTVVNGSGAAPAAVDVERIRAGNVRMPRRGALSVTVPGAVRAWETILSLGGSASLADLVAPAIDAARAGIPVAPSLARAIVDDAAELLADPGLAALLLPGGSPLRAGDLLRQPALAETLSAIATFGPDAVYAGPVGASLVDCLRARGSAIAMADLGAHASELVAPIGGAFGTDTVLTAPPNAQGVLLLETLGALAADAVDDPLGADLDLLCELFRLTAEDRDLLLADPRVVPVPIDRLLASEHHHELIRRARERRRAPRPGAPVSAPPTGDTIALVTADAAGNAVVVIQSIFDAFGSQILDPVTGVILHNRGSFFSLDPASPNVLAPRKRPTHTLMPVMVVRDGALVGVHGTMGGKAQAQIHAQLLLRLAAGMTPLQAISAPRVVVGGGGEGSPDDLVEHEPGVPTGPLEAAGFPLRALPALSEDTGHSQLIRVAADGSFAVASDPRADGAAIAG